MIKEGVSLNLVDTQGNTALHLAVSGGLDDLVKLLLESGASREARNLRNQPPFDLTIEDLVRNRADTPSVVEQTGYASFARVLMRLADTLPESLKKRRRGGQAISQRNSLKNKAMPRQMSLVVE